MELNDFFSRHKKIALAFSGGADSSYLLYAASASGIRVKAYYVKSVFQPQSELEDVKKAAAYSGTEMEILNTDVLKDINIASNPANRCYYCKRLMFETILARARADGFNEAMDGTNASDIVFDRPGMKALEEMKILSPLRLCGLTKRDVRDLSHKAGLFTWNKPACACLATRIKTGETITQTSLENAEKAETFLSSLGFSDFRIRNSGDTAKIQIKEGQFVRLMENRSAVLSELKKYYNSVVLDLESRRGAE